VSAALERSVSAQEHWMTTVLERLIAAPTTLGNEEAGQAVVRSALAECGLRPRDIAMDATAIRSDPNHSPFSWSVEGKRNVTAIWEGQGGGRSVILNGHIDVVPAAEGPWTGAPFVPRRDGDWIIGRGSGDMKAGLVSMLGALRALRDVGIELAGDVEVQSVVEEECSGNGTLQCLLAGSGADAAVLAEPHPDHLTVAQVGVVWFHIEISAAPEHARSSSVGNSVVEAAGAVLAKLRELERHLNEERSNRRYYEGFDHPISLNVGVIRGGDWTSTVPAQCRLSCRLALYPDMAPSGLCSRIEDAVAASTSDHPLLSERPPAVVYDGLNCEGFALDESEPVVSVLGNAYRFVHGEEPRLSAITSTTDARHFVRRGIPAVCFGPRAEAIHGLDERVSVSSIVDVTAVLARFLVAWCGQPRTDM
jgi:acetylornithine deacetylase